MGDTEAAQDTTTAGEGAATDETSLVADTTTEETSTDEETSTEEESAGEEEAAEAGKEDGDKSLLAEDGSDEESTGEEGEAEKPPYEEFELPEGMEADSDLLEKVTPLFRELELSQEQAQKLITAYAEHVQTLDQKRIEEHSKWRQAQRAEIKKDPETLSYAKKAVEHINDPALTQLVSGWLGDLKPVVDLLGRHGKLISEDDFVSGGKGDSRDDPDAQLARMYPSMFPKK